MNLHSSATSLRFLRTYLRDAFCPHTQRQSCRAFHLYHLVTTNQVVGVHAAKGLKRAPEFEDPKNIEFSLYHLRPRSHQFLKRLTLEEALQSYITPGVALFPLESGDSEGDGDGETKTNDRFFLAELKTDEVVPENYFLRKRKRGAKEIHLKLNQGVMHQINMLSKVWFFLRHGERVEFHIHTHKQPGRRKETKPFEFSDIQNQMEYIYLRPDVIGKALPTDSGVVIPPQIGKADLSWVVAMRENPEQDFTSIAKAAAERIEVVKQEQLDRDAHGLGIELKSERRRIKREMKLAGELQSFRQQRKETFDQIHAEDPELGALVKRKAKNSTTPQAILALYKQAQRNVLWRRVFLATLEKDDPKIAHEVRRQTLDHDSPDRVRTVLREAQRNAQINAPHRNAAEEENEDSYQSREPKAAAAREVSGHKSGQDSRGTDEYAQNMGHGRPPISRGGPETKWRRTSLSPGGTESHWKRISLSPEVTETHWKRIILSPQDPKYKASKTFSFNKKDGSRSILLTRSE